MCGSHARSDWSGRSHRAGWRRWLSSDAALILREAEIGGILKWSNAVHGLFKNWPDIATDSNRVFAIELPFEPQLIHLFEILLLLLKVIDIMIISIVLDSVTPLVLYGLLPSGVRSGES